MQWFPAGGWWCLPERQFLVSQQGRCLWPRNKQGTGMPLSTLPRAGLPPQQRSSWPRIWIVPRLIPCLLTQKHPMLSKQTLEFPGVLKMSVWGVSPRQGPWDLWSEASVLYFHMQTGLQGALQLTASSLHHCGGLWPAESVCCDWRRE